MATSWLLPAVLGNRAGVSAEGFRSPEVTVFDGDLSHIQCSVNGWPPETVMSALALSPCDKLKG